MPAVPSVDHCGACRRREDENGWGAVRLQANGFTVGQRPAPHLFEIVGAADFRSKKVHDDIARVDQHPVALPPALDRNAGSAREHFLEVLGQRQHLTNRAAAGDHKVVGDRRLAGKVDRDNLLRLSAFERLKDQIEDF